jgi:hypothetical protein
MNGELRHQSWGGGAGRLWRGHRRLLEPKNKEKQGGLGRRLGGRQERENGGGGLGTQRGEGKRGALAAGGAMRPTPARAQRIRVDDGGAARSVQTQGRVGSGRWATVRWLLGWPREEYRPSP